MQKTSGGKKKKKKKKTEYTLSPLFSLYFSFTSVDHIDTLTALLFFKVCRSTRLLLHTLSLAYKASGLVERSRWNRVENHSGTDCVQKEKVH